MENLDLVLTLVGGFVGGYALRAAKSYRRRQSARVAAKKAPTQTATVIAESFPWSDEPLRASSEAQTSR